jgi:hypothetical protein
VQLTHPFECDRLRLQDQGFAEKGERYTNPLHQIGQQEMMRTRMARTNALAYTGKRNARENKAEVGTWISHSNESRIVRLTVCG